MEFYEFMDLYYGYKKLHNKTAKSDESRAKRYFLRLKGKDIKDIVLLDGEILQ